MERSGVAIVAGVLGGVGAGLAVRFAVPPPAAAPAGPEAATSREVAEQLAEIRRLLDRPPPATPSPRAPVPPSAPGLAGVAKDALAGSGDAASPARPLSPADLQALAERAADAALERRAQKEKEASKPPATSRLPLSEIAREIGLSSSQETELRETYRSRTDRYLKLLAAPDGDPEAVRRELTDAKGDPDQIEAVKLKYVPRLLGKLADVAAIEAETAGRVSKTLGSKEAVAKYKKFTPEEQDPFGLEANVKVSSSDDR